MNRLARCRACGAAAWVVVLFFRPALADPLGTPSPIIFTDVSADSGIADALRGAYVHAIAWGDFDGDGMLDVFVGNFADRSPKFGMSQPPRNMLLRQGPRGKFEKFKCPPVEVAARCSGAAFADLDNDGDLDLYVTSNTLVVPTKEGEKIPPQLQASTCYRNDGSGSYVDISADCGACPPSLTRCRDVGVLDYDGDGRLDLFVMQDIGAPPNDQPAGAQLFRNEGELRFRNVTQEAGLTEDLWGAGIAVADLNGDRRPDIYICGSNRLLLNGSNGRFHESESLRALFNPPEKELDWVTGATFNDLDGDGDLDLATGRHHYHGTSRVHVFLNDGVKDNIPLFREVTAELGLVPLPQKSPHPEMQDFDNDGRVDLYWSTYFAQEGKRQPFLCRGLGTSGGLPRFDVPATGGIKPMLNVEGKIHNEAAATGRSMIYYVCGPAIDYDGDGDLDFLVGIWPDEPSRLFRNDTQGGHWLSVSVEGRTMNRMGIGAQVRVYRAGQAGQAEALLGFQEISVNGGYASCRPAVAHFGLGNVDQCDVTVQFARPAVAAPVVFSNVDINRSLRVKEP